MIASSPISASRRVRGLMRPEQWEGTPTRRCSSRSRTRRPARARLRAVREPAGPAPTTATSQLSCISENYRGVRCKALGVIVLGYARPPEGSGLDSHVTRLRYDQDLARIDPVRVAADHSGVHLVQPLPAVEPEA